MSVLSQTEASHPLVPQWPKKQAVIGVVLGVYNLASITGLMGSLETDAVPQNGEGLVVQHWIKTGRGQTAAEVTLARPQSLFCLGLLIPID